MSAPSGRRWSRESECACCSWPTRGRGARPTAVRTKADVRIPPSCSLHAPKDGDAKADTRVHIDAAGPVVVEGTAHACDPQRQDHAHSSTDVLRQVDSE